MKLILLAILLCLPLMNGCGDDGEDSEESTNTGGNQQSYVSERVYFAFHTECAGDEDRGDWYHVSLFEERSGTRKYRGNTIPQTGNFTSLAPLNNHDPFTTYRLELYDAYTLNCVMWIRNISALQNPIWFWDHNPTQDEVTESGAHLGLGLCSKLATTHYEDCWDN